jgi:hypothetical protein
MGSRHAEPFADIGIGRRLGVGRRRAVAAPASA